ncbi:hypothetical protein ABLQ37_24070, partial [Pseudomonas aeruginosa]
GNGELLRVLPGHAMHQRTIYALYPSRIVRPSPSQRAVQGGCPIRRGYVCPNFEELNHVGRQS